ncbi:hypothetical protein CBR_g29738 [Chara braunii]|uniref:Protein COFACTOR ASSEMBLY OF COMPLEX C SUBUNIT B CCB1, chloroplastic n=1 Tax=Chara braunii TaxID=69332 RepID=A0A388LBA7_CHABU|nr:hypothetical protein CBR_g29738 [Chara braunii]|eukprot:GBG79591.1 hypothetical protein CBR_g29738 [Chara braunii]
MRGPAAGRPPISGYASEEPCTVSPNSTSYGIAAYRSDKSKSKATTRRLVREIRRFPEFFLGHCDPKTTNPLDVRKAGDIRISGTSCALRSGDMDTNDCESSPKTLPESCDTPEDGQEDDEAANGAMGTGRRATRITGHDSGFDVPTTLYSSAPLLLFSLAAADDGSAGYSKLSYYTSLGLFVLSAPGLWSLVKRSAKSKIVRKTFVVPGPKVPNSKPLKQLAGEISSFFTRNNFRIKDSGEIVTFEGTMTPSRGQAAFLVFCTAVGLASVALVLTITAPQLGQNWYLLTTLSPLAGVYYWTRATRTEQIKVKMVLSDDESTTDVVVEGDDEQIDLLRRELALMEKNMIYVKGILEQ